MAAAGTLVARCLAALALAGCATPPCGAPCEVPEIPAELAEPGVRLWHGERSSWTILTAPKLGEVTQIVTEPAGAAPDELLLVGTRAAVRTLAPPVRARWVELEDPGDGSVPWQVEVADLDGDGVHEFLNRSGNWHPAAVYAADGALRWRTPDWGVNQLAAGHLDGDGRLDLVVGMNGDGLRRLDHEGRVVWELPVGTVWDVELADLDADGRDEILHSAACGGFFVRSGDGAVVSHARIDPPVPWFELTRWRSPDGGHRLAYLRDDHVWLVRPDGSGSRSLELGVDSRLGTPALAPMRLANGPAATGLALLVDFRVFDRSLLNLYDADGALFYQEVLPWSCRALEVDSRDPEADVLLLGCSGRLVGNGPHVSVHRRSLAINQAFEDPESPNLMEDLRAIAWALVHLERGAEALPYATRAVAIAGKSGGSGNQLAESLNTLGMVELEIDQLERAASHLGEALERVDPELDDGSRLASDIRYNLAGVHFARGELADAEALYLRSLDGTDFPADAARAAHDLASLYLDQHELDSAEAMILIAIQQDSVAFDPDHAEVKRDLALYARILRSGGRHAEAEAVEQRARAPGAPASLAE
jgi:tetratricopeptide (TPR) repeat protein